MHQLTAYYASIANNSTDALVAAIADQTTNIVSSRYQFQQNRQIFQMFASVPNGTAVRLDAPSFNRLVRPVIDPIDADATLGGNLPGMCDCGEDGPVIPKLENMGPLVTRAGAAATDCAILLWHRSQFVPKPPGKITTVRGTANCTGAAGAWALGQITFDQALPNGLYSVVGMRVTGANVLASRLSFMGQVDRPGCYANIDATAWSFPAFRFGRVGQFGTFTNTNPPQIECLAFGAIAAQVVSLDLVPLGGM